MIGADELSNFSSNQTLKTDRNWISYYAAMKLVKKLTVMTVNTC
jgi:hypothetical protein